MRDEELRNIYAYIDNRSASEGYKTSDQHIYAPYLDCCLVNLMKAGYLISWEDTKRMNGTLVIRHKSKFKNKYLASRNSRSQATEQSLNEAWTEDILKSGITNVSSEEVRPYKVFFKHPKDTALCGCLLSKP